MGFNEVRVWVRKKINNIEDLLKIYDIDYIMPECTKNDLNKILYELYRKSFGEVKIVALLFDYILCEKD